MSAQFCKNDSYIYERNVFFLCKHVNDLLGNRYVWYNGEVSFYIFEI